MVGVEAQLSRCHFDETHSTELRPSSITGIKTRFKCIRGKIYQTKLFFYLGGRQMIHLTLSGQARSDGGVPPARSLELTTIWHLASP